METSVLNNYYPIRKYKQEPGGKLLISTFLNTTKNSKNLPEIHKIKEIQHPQGEHLIQYAREDINPDIESYKYYYKDGRFKKSTFALNGHSKFRYV